MLLSAVVGVMLGFVDSSLALQPFAFGFPRCSPGQIAWRFVGRLCALGAILAACMAVGADRAVLMLAVLTGFAVQTARILRRTFR